MARYIAFLCFLLYTCFSVGADTAFECKDLLAPGLSCSELQDPCSTAIGRATCPKYCGVCTDYCDDPRACFNNGLCIPKKDGYTCSCPDTHTGLACQTPVCNDQSCQNGGTCVQNGKNYTCTCPTTHTGLLCHIEKTKFSECKDLLAPGTSCESLGDPCSDPTGQVTCPKFCGLCQENCPQGACMNGGTCVPEGSSYVCQCPDNFSGHICEITACGPNTCLNGGVCVKNGTEEACLCRTGYEGIACQISKPCASNPCQNGGTCATVNDSFVCTCPATYLGTQCEITDSGACVNQPCMNGGTCVPQTSGSYSCLCPQSYSGILCHIKETAATTTTTAMLNATCPVARTSLHNLGCLSADVIFMIEYAQSDAGSSIDHETDFVRHLIHEWKIDTNDIQVGVVVYHDTVTEAIHLGDYTNSHDLENKVHALHRQLKPSGTSDLATALHFVKYTALKNARPGVERVVIPIVHQMDSSLTQSIPAAAKDLKDDCTSIVAFAVQSPSLDLNILRQSVSQPYTDNFATYSSFNELEHNSKFFHNIQCSGQ